MVIFFQLTVLALMVGCGTGLQFGNNSNLIDSGNPNQNGNGSPTTQIKRLDSSWFNLTDLGLYYEFEEGAYTNSVAEVVDSSINSLHGQTTNTPTSTTGEISNGINLVSASNQKIIVPDHTNFDFDPTKNYSWLFWIKPASFTQWSNLWSQNETGSNFILIYVHTTADGDWGPVTAGVSAGIYTPTGAEYTHSNNSIITTGQFYHLAVTYNAAQTYGSRLTIYVDAVDQTATGDRYSSGASFSGLSVLNIQIGGNAFFATEKYNGSLDDVAYFSNRLLSAAEIQTIFDKQKP